MESPQTETQLPETKDNVVDLTKTQRKASTRDLKKMKQFEERIARTVNATPGMTRDQAIQKIQKEDYASLPVDKKMTRLEGIVGNFFQQIARDVRALRYNDSVIADAMDMNLRGMARCLELAGVTPEKQKEVLEQVQGEFERERNAQMKAQADRDELTAVQKGIEQQGETDPTDVPEPPDEATVFGG